MSSIDAAVVVDVTRLQRVFARLQFVGGGKDPPAVWRPAFCHRQKWRLNRKKSRTANAGMTGQILTASGVPVRDTCPAKS